MWGSLAASVVLLVGFVLRQRTAEHPLLPLSIVQDRDRGAGFLAILVAGSGMFGVFLFLTYYLQLTLGYGPMQTGTAFLPMVLFIVITAQVQTNILVPRFGPKIVVPLGMASAPARCSGSRRSTPTAATPRVLVGLIGMGIAMGSIMPASFQIATLGVAPRQAGAASAMVSTSQQVGGAIGTAVLNTLAATAATAYVADHAPADPDVIAAGALHSFSVAYTWSAGIFLLGAILTASLFRTRARPRGAARPRPRLGDPRGDRGAGALTAARRRGSRADPGAPSTSSHRKVPIVTAPSVPRSRPASASPRLPATGGRR